MAIATAADFVELLGRHRLLDSSQVEEAERTLVCRFPEPASLAGELVRRGWLSSYQVNLLFQDRGQDLSGSVYDRVRRPACQRRAAFQCYWSCRRPHAFCHLYNEGRYSAHYLCERSGAA